MVPAARLQPRSHVAEFPLVVAGLAMTTATWTDPLSPVTARVGAASDIGHYRELNGDLFVLDTEHPFAVVLHGMGGGEFGAEAARVGAEVVGRVLATGLAAGD